MQTERYLVPHQARERQPTLFEDLLADAIERAFGSGAHSLPELVNCLNISGPANENGEPWTEQTFQALMQRLGH